MQANFQLHPQLARVTASAAETLPGSFNVDGHVAHVVVQDGGLSDVGLAPGGGVELVKGRDVGGATHVEALGVVVDGVSALQAHDSILLAGQGTGILAAEHVLHEESALRPARREAVLMPDKTLGMHCFVIDKYISPEGRYSAP